MATGRNALRFFRSFCETESLPPLTALLGKNSQSVKLYGLPRALNIASLMQKEAQSAGAGSRNFPQWESSCFVNTNGMKSE
jgi:hypothetical protein